MSATAIAAAPASARTPGVRLGAAPLLLAPGVLLVLLLFVYPAAYGLVLSFQTRIPSGPAIILVAAGLYIVSLLFGNVSGLVRQMFPGRHLEA